MTSAEKAIVSYLPSGSGDGYGFGGGAIVSYHGHALVIGEGQHSGFLAEHIAKALNAYEAFDPKTYLDNVPF